MINFWNERYREKVFLYGKEPNEFLAQQLQKIQTGKILFPCEEEGRNAVYTTKLGWDTFAFDLSKEGFKKTKLLAKHNQVELNYQIADAIMVDYPTESFDSVALIFAHFPPTIRQSIHQKIINWLNLGGILILEAFNQLQLNNASGGPTDLNRLYTEEIIKEDFKPLKTELLVSSQLILNEGKYHQGKADIIRYVGIKDY